MKTKYFYKIEDKLSNLGCSIIMLKSLSEILEVYSQELTHNQKQIYSLIFVLIEKINKSKQDYSDLEQIVYNEL